MTSRRTFVRGQDHLALDKEEATGRRLTAVEALDAYGIDLLQEVLDYGSAVLPASEDEPAATLRSRRESLGLTPEDVAKATGLAVDAVRDCEDPATRSPIRDVERIAIALGLDERKVSVEPGAAGDDQLAVRLKRLGSAPGGLSARVVATLTEASWVIRTEARLRKLLNIQRDINQDFKPDSQYGSSQYPVWQHGYFLARKTREILDIGKDDPIESIRDICKRLGIPLLQAPLPKHLAGATVVSAGVRGIVVNTEGYNTNVWVRRATIAHELGHLLWDPESDLDTVKVDDYEEIHNLDREKRDFVEARANAFAVELLAPNSIVAEIFRTSANTEASLQAVMKRFGISHTAAVYHAWNALDRSIPLEDLQASKIDPNPTDDWRGREAFTDDYFPLGNIPSLRRGLFSALVVKAEKKGLISKDTACTYLQADNDEYKKNAHMILDLFPIDGSRPRSMNLG